LSLVEQCVHWTVIGVDIQEPPRKWTESEMGNGLARASREMDHR
jgi:hypothetical protein